MKIQDPDKKLLKAFQWGKIVYTEKDSVPHRHDSWDVEALYKPVSTERRGPTLFLCSRFTRSHIERILRLYKKEELLKEFQSNSFNNVTRVLYKLWYEHKALYERVMESFPPGTFHAVEWPECDKNEGILVVFSASETLHCRLNIEQIVGNNPIYLLDPNYTG